MNVTWVIQLTTSQTITVGYSKHHCCRSCFFSFSRHHLPQACHRTPPHLLLLESRKIHHSKDNSRWLSDELWKRLIWFRSGARSEDSANSPPNTSTHLTLCMYAVSGKHPTSSQQNKQLGKSHQLCNDLQWNMFLSVHPLLSLCRKILLVGDWILDVRCLCWEDLLLWCCPI